MHVLASEPKFDDRHRVIDKLRTQRESSRGLALEAEWARALLYEIDLLQVLAQAAEQYAGFPPGRAGEPLTHLQNSLRRWKE